MEQNHSSLLSTSASIIEKFILDYQENSWQFLKESDVHSVLYARLFDGLKNYPKIIRAAQPDNIAELNQKDHINTSLVHTEYATDFDIVILDSEAELDFDQLKRERAGQKSEAFWAQKLLAAIEIKHCQLGYNWRNFLYVPRREDVLKISRFRELKDPNLAGLFLYFIQFHMENEIAEFKKKQQSLELTHNDKIEINTGETKEYMITPDGLYKIIEVN
jgi:hypothetical protein